MIMSKQDEKRVDAVFEERDRYYQKRSGKSWEAWLCFFGVFTVLMLAGQGVLSIIDSPEVRAEAARCMKKGGTE